MKRRNGGKRRLGPDAIPTRNDKKGRGKLNPAARENLAAGCRSKTSVWEPPQAFFDKLNGEFGFTLDACAKDSTVSQCEQFFSREVDGLKEEWKGVVWCNPAGGRSQTGKWVQKCYEEALFGVTCVCLVPAETHAKWFHDYVLFANEIRFVPGQPAMVVVFRPWFTPLVMKRAALK